MPINDAERQRRRALLKAHLDAENAHDMAALLSTFSEDAEMTYNGQVFNGQELIAQAHAYMGFFGEGAFDGLRNIVDREYFTDHEIVIEGRALGVHRGEFQGYAPTRREVELPFVSFYRFDANGRLVCERVVMNLGSLGQLPTWTPP